MKNRSCAFTLVVQVSLCIVFYLALNLGKPQKSIFHRPEGGVRTRALLDVFLLSVNGGYRPLQEQTLLLKLMEDVARVYKVKFIVNISELGEDDPLTQNASRLFKSMNVPWYTIHLQSLFAFGTFMLVANASSHGSWYTAGASKDQKISPFLEQINITRGKMLTIAGLGPELPQVAMPERSMSGFGNNQSNWLTQTLEAAAGSWLIVVGQQPVVVCEENKEQVKARHVYEPLHHIFVKYGVNMYLSGHGCADVSFLDGVAYIGITNPLKSEPRLAALNGNLASRKKMDIGFLLHRVSSAEITTYFVTLSGEVIDKIVVQHRGKEVM